MRPQLMVASCLLLLLAQWGSSFDHSSSCQLQNYTVSRLGNDSEECVREESRKRIPCHTLNFLLPSINNKNCVNVTILDDQHLTIGPVKLQFVQNWTIVGSNSKSATINIHCSNESGISFEDFSSIHLRHLQFVNCTTFNNYTSNDSDYPLLEYSALYFFQGSDVVMTGCLFYNGSGTAVIMNNVAGENLIKDTHFIENRALETQENASSMNSTSGGLIVRISSMSEPASYTIEGCNFVENENYECHEIGDDVIGLSGGATFNISVSTNITIVDSSFTSNKACQGGGINVYVGQEGSRSDVRVEVVNSSFAHNHAIHEGGGMCVQLRKYSSFLSLTLQNSKFFNNSGMFGGGVSVFSENTLSSTNVTAVDSTWSGNNALTSGFAVGLSSMALSGDRPDNDSHFVIVGSFIGCKFHFNGYYNSLGAVGAVMVDGARADFTNASFYENNGTALYVRYHAYASISGSFINNRGTNGGAVHVDDSSMIGLREGVTMFQDNCAVMDGGAIFVEYYREDDTECVFESLKELLNSSKSFNVSFLNNTASSLFQSVFVGGGSGCLVNTTDSSNISMQNIMLFDPRIFTFRPNNKTQVASYAKTVELNHRPNERNTSEIEVMPGANFYLVPTVKDMFGNDAYQYGNLALVVREKEPNSYVELIGPRFISMDQFTDNSELSIRASQDMIGRDDQEMYLEFLYTQQSSYHDGAKQRRVLLTECKLGFTYNESTRECMCNSSNNLVCDSASNNYACVRYGFWHGNYSDVMSETILCPGQNCHYSDGQCPRKSRQCPDTPEFCLLEVMDGLCWNGRSGILCSECQANHSFTFSALRCVPSDTCTTTKKAFLIAGLIGYWIVLVYSFFFLLSVEMSIGSGILYGIMYYYSVVQIFTDNTLTYYSLRSLINTCVAITQLSPRVFGNIHTCFVESWRLSLQHQLFNYMTPVAVISVIVVIICFSRYCSILPKKLSLAENSPIHAMCILVLASYTSLTYTSFEILQPISIGGELRVYADPKLKYFHKEHLPYALVALFFEFAISLPVCILILFAPCLAKRVRMAKLRLRLKPILDEFQACYRPEYRWFAGFYFLARQVIYLVNIIPTGLTPENDIYLHTINFAIVIIHCSFQPYRLKWLNILDGVILADIAFTSFIRLEYVSSFVHEVVTYILILLPAAYLTLLIALVILKRLSYFFRHIKICRRRFKPSQESTHGELPSNIPSYTSVTINEDSEAPKSYEGSSFFRDTGEREPLLADSEQSDQSTNNSGGEERSRAFTTSSFRLPSVLNRSRKAYTD